MCLYVTAVVEMGGLQLELNIQYHISSIILYKWLFLPNHIQKPNCAQVYKMVTLAHG